MDGVLCDFVGAISALFNQQCNGETSLEKQLQVTPDQFWGKIGSVDGFFENLELLPNADLLMNTLIEREYDIFLLTSLPHSLPDVTSDKKKWVNHYYPFLYTKTILTTNPHKRLLAGPGRILIDDWEKNCEDFTKWGGKGIVYRDEYCTSIIESL